MWNCHWAKFYYLDEKSGFMGNVRGSHRVAKSPVTLIIDIVPLAKEEMRGWQTRKGGVKEMTSRAFAHKGSERGVRQAVAKPCCGSSIWIALGSMSQHCSRCSSKICCFFTMLG